MHLLTVVGARPQFIKAAPVSQALKAAGCEEILLHTGQHYDHNMSEVFFTELGLREPQIRLEVGSGSHGRQTAIMLTGIEREIQGNRPHCVLVYGDTNSTLAGALAAAKLQVPVVHVEAGLRSFNLRMPEEINRVVVDRLSTLLFAPSKAACENLKREGCAEHSCFLVGDVMRDAIAMFGPMAKEQSRILDQLGVRPKRYILATIHRAENTDDPGTLRTILEGLRRVAREVPVLLPLHPRTRKVIDHAGLRAGEGLHLIEPVGFLDMQRLEANALVIATDSGGVQKEAFWHGVPCVTLRHETEWVELVQAGCNQLCPPVAAEQISAIVLGARDQHIPTLPIYGDGQAATRIARHLMDWFVQRQP